MKRGRPEPLGEDDGARGPDCSAGTLPSEQSLRLVLAVVLQAELGCPRAGLAPRPPARQVWLCWWAG